MVETDFFERDDLISLLVTSLVDDSISALADLIYALELIVFHRVCAVLLD